MLTFQVNRINRSTGRTATAAAAYRTASKFRDERTGKLHDYQRKAGVIETGLVGPIQDRAELWNRAEASENRKNSNTARELILSIPHEATTEQQVAAVKEIGHELATRYQVAVDWAIHAPNRKGDQRNIHAHVMFTTRAVTRSGEFGAKTRILDVKQTSSVEITSLRKKWSEICQGIATDKEAWDHRSYAERGIEKIPQKHLGVAAIGTERRTGKPSKNRINDDPRRLSNLAKRAEAFDQIDEEQKQKFEAEISEPLPAPPKPPKGIVSLLPSSRTKYDKKLKKHKRELAVKVAMKERIKRQIQRIESALKSRIRFKNKVIQKANEKHFEERSKKIIVAPLAPEEEVPKAKRSNRRKL